MNESYLIQNFYFLPNEIVINIFDLIYKNIDCKVNNLSLYNNLSITCKLFFYINKNYNSCCNIISFENNYYCSKHNSLEYDICKYLNNLRKNNGDSNNSKPSSEIIQPLCRVAKQTYSYHIKDENLDKKFELEDIFNKITSGTEFIFTHCCCRKKGLMFDIV